MFLGAAIFLAAHALQGAEQVQVDSKTNILEIFAVTAKGKSFPISYENKVRLKPSSEDIAIFFNFTTNIHRQPCRLIYKLDGYDDAWHKGGGEMFLIVRFYDETGYVISKTEFEVDGDSAGWINNPNHSSLTHRRETVTVPPRASRVMIVVSSAGPSSTEGVYIVEDLLVSEFAEDKEATPLLQFPNIKSQKGGITNFISDIWIRDGTTPSMAKIIELGQNPTTAAFEILDDDPLGHAEWHNTLESAPKVTPGNHIVIEWNEMFSIGESALRVANYPSLPPGKFLFHAAEVNLMGVPTGVAASLTVIVPQPFWKTIWFWSIVSIGLIVVILMFWRYTIRVKIRREMLRLEKQHLLEQERLRIARDIHDDLGARVTQISLVSALANSDLSDSKGMRKDLEQISQMSRDLVTALYETVWAVDPENDNLKELGNYLFQVINELCERGKCRCRFQSDELPREIVISSQVRHNLCMAAKEAVHNVIKHAHASEVKVRVEYKNSLLSISIQDDGRGFSVAENFSGHGLNNMKRRLHDIGGRCHIESRPNHGTSILIQLEIKPIQAAP